MKTISKRVLFVITMMTGFLYLGTNKAKAQSNVTHYYYAYTLLEKNKVGFTPVVSSTVSKYTTLASCELALKRYMMDYIPAYTNYKAEGGYSSYLSDGGDSRSVATESRNSEMARLKNLGYEVVYFNSIDYKYSE